MQADRQPAHAPSRVRPRSRAGAGGPAFARTSPGAGTGTGTGRFAFALRVAGAVAPAVGVGFAAFARDRVFGAAFAVCAFLPFPGHGADTFVSVFGAFGRRAFALAVPLVRR